MLHNQMCRTAVAFLLALSLVLAQQQEDPSPTATAGSGQPAASTTPTPPTPPPYDSARPLIVTKYGIVSASNFLASVAGAKVLEQGGNAIDAAIAANAMTGLTQPFVNGIGGDLFAIIYEAKTGRLYGLNSSGWTPKL